MAQSKKVEDFDTAPIVAADDQLVLNVREGANTFVIYNTEVQNVFRLVPDNVRVSVDHLVVRQATNPDLPVDSADYDGPRGRFWYDGDFIYVAVSNTEVKRAALSTF